MHDFLQSPWIVVVGLALVHFVWQGALVHAVLGVVLPLVPAGRASVRYALACVALLVMFAAPIVTVARLAPAPVAVVPVVALSDVTASEVVAGASPEAAAARGVEAQAAAVPTGATAGQESIRRALTRPLAPLLPTLVVAWLVGVAILLVRLAGGLALAHAWRTRHVAPVSAEIAQVAAAVAARVGVRRAVAVFVSVRVTVPMVVGVLRPVVLLPASAVMGLSVRQLEVLLAHEFAHVKRLDPLVNAFQNVVEAVLFYHPSVWMVSRLVRREREFCCDEVATATGGDRLLYASTLRDLAVLQRSRAAVGMAATGGALLERIRRLVAGPAASPTNGFAIAFSALSVVLLIGLASALGSGERLERALAGAESVHVLTGEEVVGMLAEAPSLPMPERVAVLEALAPVAVNPPVAAAAFQRAVATLPGDALEGAHPALAWPPYPAEGDGTWVWVTAVGSVRFTDDYRDVVAVHPEGWLRIEARHADGVRSVVAESAGDDAPELLYGADGRIEVRDGVRIEYFVDGVPAAWDAAAQEWLARTLSLDPAWDERLRALEREIIGSGGTLTTGATASSQILRIAPSAVDTFGASALQRALEGLGVPNPDFPDRPAQRPFPNADAAAKWAVIGAYHLVSHGLVTPHELEAFLEAVREQLSVLEERAARD